MPIDHVSFAAEGDGARATGERLAAQLRVDLRNGGIHPQFGTRNVILPMAQGRYVEVVEPLEHPSAAKASFGQAVRLACEAGGGWMQWVVRVYDIGTHSWRLRREPIDAHRVFPDGRYLRWKQIDPTSLVGSPQLPVLVHYVNPELHPSLAVGVEPRTAITGLTIAGDSSQIEAWLGPAAESGPRDVPVTVQTAMGAPRVVSVTFMTPDGLVTL